MNFRKTWWEGGRQTVGNCEEFLLLWWRVRTNWQVLKVYYDNRQSPSSIFHRPVLW